MKQHPVPQNVIEVEFKLFGSFTLKQFSKVLGASMIGAVVFVLPLPVIIKLPISAICVLTGFGMAIIPNLGVWLVGLIKALFISPRYVWVRSSTPPDVLKVTPVSSSTGKKAVNPTLVSQSAKLDLDSLDLKSIYSTTKVIKPQNINKVIKPQNINSENVTKEPSKVSEDNFVRVYEDVFGEGLFNRSKESALNSVFKEEFSNKAKVQLSKDQQIAKYKEEISKLKYQLSLLSKDLNYKKNEESILTRINDIYREIKLLENNPINLNSTQSKGNLVNAAGVTFANGKILNGIIVSKKDVPIPDCLISFIDKQKNVIYRTRSSADGKFSTGSAIPNATYAVAIDHPQHKFFTYMIEVNDSKLPAFRFREK